MKKQRSRFVAILASIGAPVLGGSGGACGVACFAGGCCGGTAIFGLLGVSGSTLSFMQTLTPVFLILTVLSLSYGFYNAYKSRPAVCCAPVSEGETAPCCDTPRKTSFLQSKSFLWVVTLFCVVMGGDPLLSGSSQTGNGGAHRAGGDYRQSDSVNVKSGQAADAKSGACCPAESNCETECQE
jgi:hypothetical protein